MMKKIKIKQKLNSNPIGFKKFVVIIKNILKEKKKEKHLMQQWFLKIYGGQDLILLLKMGFMLMCI